MHRHATKIVNAETQAELHALHDSTCGVSAPTFSDSVFLSFFLSLCLSFVTVSLLTRLAQPKA